LPRQLIPPSVTLVPPESSLQVWEPRTATPARPVRTAASLSSWTNLHALRREHLAEHQLNRPPGSCVRGVSGELEPHAAGRAGRLRLRVRVRAVKASARPILRLRAVRARRTLSGGRQDRGVCLQLLLRGRRGDRVHAVRRAQPLLEVGAAHEPRAVPVRACCRGLVRRQLQALCVRHLPEARPHLQLHECNRKFCSECGAESSPAGQRLPAAGGDRAGRPGRAPGRCGCAVTSLLQRGCGGAVC